MGNTVKKFKQKKTKSVIKRAIAIMGFDSDKTPILIHIKSRSFMDKTYNATMSKIKALYNLPMIEKPINSFSNIEREVLNLRKDQDSKNRLFMCYNTESEKYKEIENELIKMQIAANITASFDMEQKIDLEGEEVNHWERWNIPEGDYIELCKFLIKDEKDGGFNLSQGSIGILTREIELMFTGEKTQGDLYLESLELKESAEKIINEAEEKGEVDEGLEGNKPE